MARGRELVVGESEAAVGTFQGVLVVLMMLSAPLWNWLSQRTSNRKLLMISMIALGVVLALNYLVGLIPGIPVMAQALIMSGLIGPFLGGYFILAYAMMGSVVDYDEMSTNSRREAIYYGTFSLAASVGPSIAALVLPMILENLGYTTANPLGVRVAWLVAAGLAFLGAAAFIGYRLGDTPEETRQNLALETAE